MTYELHSFVCMYNFAFISLLSPLLLPLSSSFKYVQFLINPNIIILHMHSSHHSITLNAPKNNDLFFNKSIFLFFISVARDSNVSFYVLMWSLRQQYVFFVFFFSLLFISYNLLHVSSFFFFYILNMYFYFSHLTCTFHFNCCLNKIFVIVMLNYARNIDFEIL